MIYNYEGDLLQKYPTLAGDGVTDDTTALQALVDTYSSVRLPSDLVIKISSTITIDPEKCVLFDGGNSTILVSGDISALKIAGSMTTGMSANPNTLNADIMNKEAGCTICNCKIQGGGVGVGIEVDGAFKPVIRNNYIHHTNTGILLKNMNRDVQILGNNIYASTLYGVCIDSTANIHQLNINDNIINYAKYCIVFDKPLYIANVQICGNDIEVSSYPTSGQANFRCIMVDCDTDGSSIETSIFEMEITGNTCQGHATNTSVIEFTGGTYKTRHVSDVNITGNHISNSAANLIDIQNVARIAITGNTMKVATEYAVSIADGNGMVSVADNICEQCGGFIESTDSLVRLIVNGNISNTGSANPYNLVGSEIKNAIINANVLSGSNTGMVVNPTSVTRVLVTSNVVGSSTYSLHSGVTASNNI